MECDGTRGWLQKQLRKLAPESPHSRQKNQRLVLAINIPGTGSKGTGSK